MAIGGSSSSPPNAAARAARDRLDVDQGVGRVGRAFEIDQRDAALGLGRGHDLVQLLARRAGREVDILHPELAAGSC